MNYKKVAEEIKAAFLDGRDSFDSPALPYSTDDEAWNASETKYVYDRFMDRHNRCIKEA